MKHVGEILSEMLVHQVYVRAMIERMEGLGWDKIQSHDFCYDFPEVVIHRGKECPRESGDVCYALPRPEPPFTEDEKSAVYHYVAMMAGKIKPKPRSRAPGTTIVAGQEVHE